MNIENILKLADVVEKTTFFDEGVDPYRWIEGPHDNRWFNMESYAFPCGSPACIAGHAAVIAHGRCRNMNTSDVFHTAIDWLELDQDTAKELFLETSTRISPTIAAAVLRELAATGEVNWPDEIHYSEP